MAARGVDVTTPVTVVDAHVHFWTPSVLRYAWLGQVPALRRAFLPSHLASLSSGETNALIFIEANCDAAMCEQEVAFVETLALAEPRIAGIVAYADMLATEGLHVHLARLRRSPRVVGVRHNIQGNVPGYCTQPLFVRGVEQVGEIGLTFDLCVTPDQLHEAFELVRQCPRTKFILDHCGKPAIKRDAFPEWGDKLSQLAAQPNVSCKLSGLFTEVRPEQQHHDVLLPYAAHALACFGDERLMYGSDWPVVTLAAGEPAWRTFCNEFTRDWTAAARQRFFADNAVRTYQLSPSTPV